MAIEPNLSYFELDSMFYRIALLINEDSEKMASFLHLIFAY